VSHHFDPALLTFIVLLLGSAARSLVLITTAAVSLYSRNPARRAAARRLIRLLTRADHNRSS